MKTILMTTQAVLMLVVLLSGAAHAGWYVGAAAGETDSTSDVGFDNPPSTETDDSGFAWSVFGGYDFSKGFAFEFGYGDLGDDYTSLNLFGNGERIEWGATTIDLTLIGRVSIHERVRLYGRLGVAYWDVDLKYRDPGFGSSGSDNDVDALIGGGFEWQVGESLGIRFEWKQFQNVGDEVKTDLPPSPGGRLQLNGRDVSVLGLGLTWRFEK